MYYSKLDSGFNMTNRASKTALYYVANDRHKQALSECPLQCWRRRRDVASSTTVPLMMLLALEPTYCTMLMYTVTWLNSFSLSCRPSVWWYIRIKSADEATTVAIGLHALSATVLVMI
jgi:hypothetical protein